MDLTPLTQDVHRLRDTPGIQRRQDAAAGPRGLSTQLAPLHQRDRYAGHRELARHQLADEPAAHHYHIALIPDSVRAALRLPRKIDGPPSAAGQGEPLSDIVR